MPTPTEIVYLVSGRNRSPHVRAVDNVWSFSNSTGKFVQTHTVEHAAIAAGSDRFPLILFSPAAGNESAAYLSQIENLVSHGYIVASFQSSESLDAISFQDTRLTAFQADMRRAFFFPGSRDADAILDRAQRFEQVRENIQSAKLRLVFDQTILIATDRNQRAPFADRIDLGHVGAFGHGSGGNAVTKLCASDLRISAAWTRMDGHLAVCSQKQNHLNCLVNPSFGSTCL